MYLEAGRHLFARAPAPPTWLLWCDWTRISFSGGNDSVLPLNAAERVTWDPLGWMGDPTMMESGQKVRHDTFVLPYQILQLQKSSDKRFLIGLTTQSGILESVPKSFLVS